MKTKRTNELSAFESLPTDIQTIILKLIDRPQVTQLVSTMLRTTSSYASDLILKEYRTDPLIQPFIPTDPQLTSTQVVYGTALRILNPARKLGENLPDTVSAIQLNTIIKARNLISFYKKIPDSPDILQGAPTQQFTQIKEYMEQNRSMWSAFKVLDLGQSNLTAIPEEIQLFNQLETLNLAGNRIENIEILGSLTTLKRLMLGDNQIQNISVLKNLSSLRFLEIVNNPIDIILLHVELRELIDGGLQVQSAPLPPRTAPLRRALFN